MTPWQIMTISNTATVWVDADVYERDIASVSVGSKVKIRVTALPGREFTGKVLRISPVVDKSSRSVKVRAEIPNSDRLLKDGEYAEISIQSGRPHRALLVPLTAVEHEGELDYVFVQNGPKFKKLKVERGTAVREKVEIVSGLAAGDVVVSKGAIFLGDQASDD